MRIFAYKGTIVTSLTHDYLGKTQSKCRLCTWSNSHPFIGLGSTQRTSRLHLDDLGAISLGIAPPTTKCHHHAVGRTPALDVATAKTYDHLGVFQVIAESTAVPLANKQPQRFCGSRSRHHVVVRRAVSVEKTSEEFGDSALAFTAHTDKAFGFLPHAAQFDSEGLQGLIPTDGFHSLEVAPLTCLLQRRFNAAGTVQVLESGSAQGTNPSLVNWVGGVAINVDRTLFLNEPNPDAATSGAKLTNSIHRGGATPLR